MQNKQGTHYLENNFALSQQVIPPPEIQSVRLHPADHAGAPPVINLHGSSSFVLEFDLIDSTSRQFKLSISHREKNWRESSLPPNDYVESFSEVYFNDNHQSLSQNPKYFHYTYSFPNQRIKFTKSGNYLLSVYDDHSNTLLFRVPFFVAEDVGKLQTHFELLYAQRKDGRELAQPFSVYRYPYFVTQPQFDLAFVYVQNRFWGRARSTDFFDTASPGEVHFHLDRDQSFIKNYEFNVLDLQSFRPDGRQIIDYQPAETPPTIRLRRDMQQFSSTLSRYPGPIHNIRDERQAKYGNVVFSLETDKNAPLNDKLYVVGDFNNWLINPANRMTYDSTVHLWQGQALIKQGTYVYKYVRLENNVIDDLAMDRGFTSAKQEYMTFIYFNDPAQHFDRLLKVDLSHY